MPVPAPAAVPLSTVGWTPRRRAVGELAAAAGTVGAWVAAEALGLKVWALPLLAVWAVYLVARAVRRPDLWVEWGLRPTGWRHGLAWHGGAMVAALSVVAAVGAVRASLALPTHAWVLLLLYPPWALCQQFVLQNVVVANAAVVGIKRAWLPFLGMLLFGAAHLPDLRLAGLTALGGLLWTGLWLRARNLWLLALGHAAVGTFAFLWVLGRDPLLEFPELAAWLGPVVPA